MLASPEKTIVAEIFVFAVLWRHSSHLVFSGDLRKFGNYRRSGFSGPEVCVTHDFGSWVGMGHGSQGIPTVGACTLACVSQVVHPGPPAASGKSV